MSKKFNRCCGRYEFVSDSGGGFDRGTANVIYVIDDGGTLHSQAVYECLRMLGIEGDLTFSQVASRMTVRMTAGLFEVADVNSYRKRYTGRRTG